MKKCSSILALLVKNIILIIDTDFDKNNTFFLFKDQFYVQGLFLHNSIHYCIIHSVKVQLLSDLTLHVFLFVVPCQFHMYLATTSFM